MLFSSPLSFVALKPIRTTNKYGNGLTLLDYTAAIVIKYQVCIHSAISGRESIFSWHPVNAFIISHLSSYYSDGGIAVSFII